MTRSSSDRGLLATCPGRLVMAVVIVMFSSASTALSQAPRQGQGPGPGPGYAPRPGPEAGPGQGFAPRPGLDPRVATRPAAGGPSATRPAVQPAHPLDPALRMAYEALPNIQQNIDDYTAIMKKRERVDGELIDQTIFAKVRNRKKEGERTVVPFSVYVKVLEPKSIAGREAIYVEGRNDNKLVAHDVGLRNLIRVNLKPRGYWAMMGTRYPITDIGLDTMVEKLIEKGERDRQRDECDVKFYRDAKVGGRLCTHLVVSHPVPREHFDFHIAEIFIDDERNVPLRYAAYKWPTKKGGEPILDEEVTYFDLKLNVGLTEKDFDPDNKEYNYP